MRNEETKDKKQEEEKWLNWAIELQSLAQAGLAMARISLILSGLRELGRFRRK